MEEEEEKKIETKECKYHVPEANFASVSAGALGGTFINAEV